KRTICDRDASKSAATLMQAPMMAKPAQASNIHKDCMLSTGGFRARESRYYNRHFCLGAARRREDHYPHAAPVRACCPPRGRPPPWGGPAAGGPLPPRCAPTGLLPPEGAPPPWGGPAAGV